MSKTLKYGIVGAGHLGNYHAQQLNNIPGVELIGVFDLLKEKAAIFSKIHLTYSTAYPFSFHSGNPPS